MIWAHIKSGQYTVKSGYGLGKRHSLVNHVCWKLIWGANTLLKVKSFLWRLCHNIIPTKGILKSRHLGTDDKCLICNEEEETPFHGFLNCNKVKALWQLLDPSIQIPYTNMNFPDIMKIWYDTLTTKNFSMFVTMLWYIWFRRN